MPIDSDIATVTMQVSRGVIVASVQMDLDDEVITRFREDLLQRIQGNAPLGVIVDLSGQELIDSHEFASLVNITRMCDIMGSPAVLAGLRPGIVSALVEAGAEVTTVRAALDLDHAFSLLEPKPEPENCSDKEDPAADAADEDSTE